MSSSSKSLIVVRGSYRGVDPYYSSLAQNAENGKIVTVELDDTGNVLQRQIFNASDSYVVEAMMEDPTYKGVIGDMRTDHGLVSLEFPQTARPLDLKELQRSTKTPEIARTLQKMRNELTNAMQHSSDPNTFRGVLAEHNDAYKYAFRVEKYNGFVQYRGGLQDTSTGLTIENTEFEAKTPEWEARLQRAYRGLDAVAEYLYYRGAGATVESCNATFMEYMDDEKDFVYGDVVRLVGYGSPFEDEVGDDIKTIRALDVPAVVAHVGDQKETARIYGGIYGKGNKKPQKKTQTRC